MLTHIHTYVNRSVCICVYTFEFPSTLGTVRLFGRVASRVESFARFGFSVVPCLGSAVHGSALRLHRVLGRLFGHVVCRFGFLAASCLRLAVHGSALRPRRVSGRLFCRFQLFNRLPRKEGQFYTTNSPFTHVGGESTRPVFFRNTTSFSIDKILVSMSDPFSSVWIFAKTNSFSSTLSRNQ